MCNRNNIVKMINRLLFIVLFLLSFTSFSQTNKEIVQKTIQKYRQHKAISYDIDYTFKFFDNDKPSMQNGWVKLIRLENDTLFGSIICYNTKFKTHNIPMDLIKYYDGDKLYLINKADSLITQYNPSDNQKWPITTRVDGSLINTYFIRPNWLKNAIEDKENKVLYSDTANFIKVNITFPDTKNIYDRRKNIYINKSAKTISKITFQARYKDQIQKDKWELSHIDFDTITPKSIRASLKPYFKKFEMEVYKPKPPEYYDLLKNGEAAPKLKGYTFPDYNKENEIRFNKITVLDFWYTACMPCIKVTPEINKLKKKYKDKINVIGVNNHEHRKKDKSKIQAFLNRTPMDYKIFLVDSIPEKYNITAYPTLYVIGKDGRVKYSHIGYKKNLFEKLDSVIQNLSTKSER